MPNPSNGTLNNTLNAAYGDGVMLKKLTGTGNGRNFLSLSQESEDEALSTGFSRQPLYQAGGGPVDIRIIDPVKLAGANWEIRVYGDSALASPPTQSGVIRQEATSWMLIRDDNQDTIYSEKSANLLNEQILEEYGLSVSLLTGRVPGSAEVKEGKNGYISSDITFLETSKTWLSGLVDGEAQAASNWIRSGSSEDTDPNDGCATADVPGSNVFLDPQQAYENLLANSSLAAKTWAPYALGVRSGDQTCGLETVNSKTVSSYSSLQYLQSVDVVYTPDRSKWTRCVVVEMQATLALAENKGVQFGIRRHKSWTGDVDNNGAPIYGSITGDPVDSGMSWFPGYAINQETGERLNIIFGEDSYLRSHNGGDMIWNPTTTINDAGGNKVFGGRHYIYITRDRYDSGKVFAKQMSDRVNTNNQNKPWESIIWTSIPTVATGYSLRSLSDGLIPTETRIRLRVERPFARFVPSNIPTKDSIRNGGYPLYTFSTLDLAPHLRTDFSDVGQSEKDRLLDLIKVVPNPYFAYSDYERSRLDTRCRITNLPKKATISIYSVDGSLVRKYQKDDASVSYVDWDLRNFKGLPASSGMYLIHVQAEGLGDKVVKWFGAMRPTDISKFQ
jgi:hypothetical protein